MWLIVSVSEPPNLNKLIEMPQEPDIGRQKTGHRRGVGPRLEGKLTAVSFIRTIQAICAVVASVFRWDAGPIGTGELVAGARPSSWWQSGGETVSYFYISVPET